MNERFSSLTSVKLWTDRTVILYLFSWLLVEDHVLVDSSLTFENTKESFPQTHGTDDEEREEMIGSQQVSCW